MASVEDSARSSLENLIKELNKERQVSNKQRTLNEQLIAKLTSNEEEKADLVRQNRELQFRVHQLEKQLNTHASLGIDTTTKDTSEMSTEGDSSAVSVAVPDTVPIDDVFEDADEKDDDISGAIVKAVDVIPIDSIPMNERRRMLIKTIMIIRLTFRGYFGLSFANRWGFYVDRHMSRKIHEFGYWIDYPKGNHVLKKHKKYVRIGLVSPDGCYLYTGSFDKSIIVWDLSSNEAIKQLEGHTDSIWALDYRRGILVSGDFDNKIKVWYAYNDYELMHTLEGHTEAVTSLSLNKAGALVVSGSSDATVRLWSVKSGKCMRVFEGHTGAVRSVCFLHSMIISGSEDHSIKVWNSTDDSKPRTITESITNKVYTLSVNCDTSLVACFFGKGFTVYKWPEMSLMHSIDVPTNRGRFHPLIPNILVVLDRDVYLLKLVDINTGNEIHSFGKHKEYINDVCFSPDGMRLFSMCSDKNAYIWDLSEMASLF